jgi:malonyl CoA-acyl carrier protein transacylase/acyl carrier protein
MQSRSNPKLAMLFPGQGAFTNSTLGELYSEFPELHRHFEIARSIIQSQFGKDLSIYLSPDPQTDEFESIESDFEISQCAIFLASYFTFRILGEMGVRPDVVVGHSIGELAALTAAEVFTFETGLRLLCQRTKSVLDFLPKGKMVAATCEAKRMAGLLEYLNNPDLEMGVINGPKQVVISGTDQAMQEFLSLGQTLGISMHVLKAQYPFHSRKAFRGISPFIASARQSLSNKPPKFPVYSPIARRFYGPDEDFLDHLGLHLIDRVEFAHAVHELYAHGVRHFIEMGDRSTLTNLVKINLTESSDILAIECHSRSRGFKLGIEKVVHALGRDVPANSGIQAPSKSAPSLVAVPPVIAPSADIEQRVLAIFKDLTKYPVEVLELDANLESDLGLDSIKQIEILSKVASDFGFPLPQDLELSSVNTIRKLLDYLGKRSGQDPLPTAPAPAGPRPEIKDKVLAIFRELTNYPEEVLELDAKLESDLGLDSIKQIEIVSRICSELDIPMRQDMNFTEIDTIRKIIAGLESELGLKNQNRAA